VAFIGTVPLTVAPEAGLVRVPVGATESTVTLYGAESADWACEAARAAPRSDVVRLLVLPVLVIAAYPLARVTRMARFPLRSRAALRGGA